MIFDSSKNKSPCFHRTIPIQIDSPLPQDDTQAVSTQSDVELHNKSSPNLIFHVFCLWFWMALKIKVPASTEQFQFRLTVHYPKMTLKQFQDNLMLNYIIKALQTHIIPDLPLIFDSSKNKSPCFHRTIPIQIDSPLPQDDTQAVSTQSDVELHNKRSPNLIFHVFCLWFWMALKIKVPASTEQFQFRLTVHYPRMPLKQFQDNLMLNYKIKALQISYFTSSVCDLDSFKNKSPCFHRTIPIQIDSPLPQDDTQAVSRQSDVELHNKSSPKLTLYLICLWILIALKIKVPASTEQFQYRLTVHYPRMPLKQFQDNLILNYIIKALQSSHYTWSAFDFW